MRLSSFLLVALLLGACAEGDQGPVMHIDLRVPIRSAAAGAIGSSCDIESLRATGPKVPMIPGADFMMIDLDEARRRAQSQDELVLPTVAIVPVSGTVVESGGDDPGFPVDCSFTFDVPDDANTQAWAFGVDSIYLPVPLIPRDVLESTNGTAVIIVNPQ